VPKGWLAVGSQTGMAGSWLATCRPWRPRQGRP